MTTFTSTLPEELFEKLNHISKQLALPKNKIIEKALRIYIEQIHKAEYIQSFKQMNDDDEIIKIAEEGMVEYLNQLSDK
jgi:predicted DNA-binding protein